MNREDFELYFIMGSTNCENPLNVLEQALQAGITCFQLREKGEGRLYGEAYRDFALACQTLCRRYKVPFIVNDDVQFALEIEADGVHIGQEDCSLAYARKLHSNKWIGVSVHNMEQMAEAVRLGADYVGIGPIYPTTSKADAEPPSGLDFLQQTRRAYPDFPIIAIGGIRPENALVVRQAGADGLAVISAIIKSSDIQQTVACFLL